MYYYIYDSYLKEKKYQIIISKAESKLTDLGINGKINYLSFLKNIEQIIKEEIKQGISTIVVAGNDKTLNQIINYVADLDIVIGFIPVGPHNNIAKLLGIPEGEFACDVLSARIVKKIDLGKINDNYYFFTTLETPGDNINLNCDNSYFISLEGKNNIININNLFSLPEIPLKANKGYLSLIIKNIKRELFFKEKISFSYFKGKKINLSSNSNKSLPILLTDEKRIIKTPLEIKIVPQKIKIIVGRDRIIE